jgi:hypothetical protein
MVPMVWPGVIKMSIVVSPSVILRPSATETSRLGGRPQSGLSNSSLVSIMVQSASLATMRELYF